MPKKSEETLSNWTGPASDSEEQRYNWTKDQIGKALHGRSLDHWLFRVYPKGSYPNRTNVVRDSDVDIAVELTGLIRHEFIHKASDLTMADLDLTPYTGDYSVARFKTDVEAALIDHFGSAPIDRGNKAIHVRESSQGLKADVVVCQSLRSHLSRFGYRDGIEIRPDNGGVLHNFPKQHLQEGLNKNERTNLRYKKVVRILKRLENEMVEKGVIEVEPSFLIESCVWNVPDAVFTATPSWTDRVSYSLGAIFGYTKEPEPSAESDRWAEANDCKFLFHPAQSWTREDARDFALAAFGYLDPDD